MILLDTDIMVDVMRRHVPAVNWLGSLGSERVGIPGLVAMELLQGCRDRREQQRVEKVLRPFSLYWPDRADCARAFDDFAAHHLARNIGILDALIAETAVGLGVSLATFNERHYVVVRTLQIIRPYARDAETQPGAGST
jgi:predicted nucleic acid-binding protein